MAKYDEWMQKKPRVFIKWMANVKCSFFQMSIIYSDWHSALLGLAWLKNDAINHFHVVVFCVRTSDVQLNGFK